MINPALYNLINKTKVNCDHCDDDNGWGVGGKPNLGVNTVFVIKSSSQGKQ